jgi:hypothetical protein
MSLKDWIKLKPYWFKGGAIGVIISLIFSIIYLLYEAIDVYFLSGGGDNTQILFPIVIFIYIIPLYILPVTFITFLIGAVVGWIFGKIKSRK